MVSRRGSNPRWRFSGGGPHNLLQFNTKIRGMMQLRAERLRVTNSIAVASRSAL